MLRSTALFLLFACLTALCAADAPEPAAGLRFTVDETLTYVYRSRQTVRQQINDDEIEISSEIAWRFGLHCVSSNEQQAQLKLTIAVIRASIEAPGFSHRIDTSLPDDQLQVPLIGHLCLLSAQTLNLTYDYTRQRLSAVSGAEHIQQAFRRVYPAPEFDDEPDDPRFERVKQQYSNEALLRLWREIIRPPGQGSDTLKLEEPFAISVQRQWQDTDKGHSYSLKTADEQLGREVTLDVAPNPVKARLKSLSGDGALRLGDGRLLEATGNVQAELGFAALTQQISQQLDCSWALQLQRASQASE